MTTILITDSLFIGPEEERVIKAASYDIDRLDKPCATEDELVASVKGKVGYIQGGIERITARVIDAADELRVISFTGSGYTEFIPGWRQATARGIAITTAAGGNALSVAEFALTLALTQVRRVPSLSSQAGMNFFIAHEFSALTLGIIGFGHVGRSLADKARALGFNVVATAGAHSAAVNGVEILDIDSLVEKADVISLHVSKQRGDGILDRRLISKLRKGCVVVNTAFDSAIDNAALLDRIKSGELVAAVDYHLDSVGLPPGSLISSNAQTAFNTAEATARISARATKSLLAVLKSGSDPDVVNPEYAKNR